MRHVSAVLTHDIALEIRFLSRDFIIFCDIKPMYIGLWVMLVDSFVSFLTACIMLNVKVAPITDGSESVNGTAGHIVGLKRS